MVHRHRAQLGDVLAAQAGGAPARTRPLLFAATQDVPGNSCIGPDGLGSVKGFPVVRRPARKGRDEERAAQLWAATEELTGL